MQRRFARIALACVCLGLLVYVKRTALTLPLFKHPLSKGLHDPKSDVKAKSFIDDKKPRFLPRPASPVIDESDIKVTSAANSNVIKEAESQSRSLPSTASSAATAPAPHVGCRLPVLDPWDPDLLQYISHPRSYNCSQVQENLTHLTEDGLLVLNQTLVVLNNKSGDFHCSVKPLNNGKYNGYSSGPPSMLIDRLAFPQNSDSLSVTCAKGKSQVYANLYNHPRNISRNILPNDIDHLSLIVLFFDGVSFSMFRRHLPETYKFMTKKMGFLMLKGHVKVADNSFLNMMPFYTGLRAGNQGPGLRGEIFRERSQRYDDFDLIWKRFAKEGYATSYFEDWPHVGIFHMETGGFAQPQPADHYFFAYNKVTEKSQLSTKSTQFCFGNVGKYEKAIDTTESIIKHYRGKRLWAMQLNTEMSHGFVSDLERADDTFKNFFERMHSKKYFANTAIIVMADHGARYPPFRHKLVGRLEDKMPVLGYYFPPEFHAKYPHIRAALKANEYRLTTHFDTHQTMLDILNGNFGNDTKSNVSNRGLSQLRPIPIERTCKDAQIPVPFCACNRFKAIPISSNISNLGHHLTAHVNRLLFVRGLERLCANLSLTKVISAEREIANPKVQLDTTSSNEKTRIAIIVSPSDGQLEATISHTSGMKNVSVVGDVDRINRYGNQSSCIQDHDMQKFCFCKSLR